MAVRRRNGDGHPVDLTTVRFLILHFLVSLLLDYTIT
jgi:hypothetical protein